MIVLTNFWVFQNVFFIDQTSSFFGFFHIPKKKLERLQAIFPHCCFIFRRWYGLNVNHVCLDIVLRDFRFPWICCKSSTIKILQIRLTTILSHADRSPVISSCLNGASLVNMKMNLHFWRIAPSFYVRNTWKTFCSAFYKNIIVDKTHFCFKAHEKHKK